MTIERTGSQRMGYLRQLEQSAQFATAEIPLQPTAVNLNGKAGFDYISPTGTDFVHFTLSDPKAPQPVVTWRPFVGRLGGELVLHLDKPVDKIAVKGHAVVDVPLGNDEKHANFSVDDTTLSLRQTPEGLASYFFLKPEIDADGTHLYHSPEGKTFSFKPETGKKVPQVMWRERLEATKDNKPVTNDFVIELKEGEAFADAKTQDRVALYYGEAGKKPAEISITPKDAEVAHFSVKENLKNEQYVVVEKASIVEAQGAAGGTARVVVSKTGKVERMRIKGKTELLTKASGPDNTNAAPIGVDRITVSGRGNKLNGWKVDRFSEITRKLFLSFQLGMEDTGRTPEWDDDNLLLLNKTWKDRDNELVAKLNNAQQQKPKPSEVITKETKKIELKLGMEGYQYKPVPIYDVAQRREELKQQQRMQRRVKLPEVSRVFGSVRRGIDNVVAKRREKRAERARMLEESTQSQASEAITRVVFTGPALPQA